MIIRLQTMMHTKISTIESEKRNQRMTKRIDAKRNACERNIQINYRTPMEIDEKDDKMRLTLLLYYYVHVALNPIALKVDARICIFFLYWCRFFISVTPEKQRICTFPRLWQIFFWLHVFLLLRYYFTPILVQYSN